MGYWQLSLNGGAPQDAAAWGIDSFKRTRQSAKTDTVTFSLPGADFTAAGPFAYKAQVTIYQDGEPWFYGWVSKPPRKGSPTAESLEYELSGPWWWIERTPFQQMWVSQVPGAPGAPLAQITTAQSSVILGQSLDGTKLNSGQVILDALLYAQYAFLGQAFPAEIIEAIPPDGPPTWWPQQVDPTYFIGLAPAPNPGAGQRLPFLIGKVTPSVVTTYSQVRDKSCGDIVRLAMRYSPDAVAWCDYSTTPPTLHIDRRGNLAGRTISVAMNQGANKSLGEFNPTPRYDLVPSTVLVKYQTTNNINGTQASITNVDQYPPGVPDNDPFAIVFTTDLVGGHTTEQTAEVVTRSRPTAATDANALGWVFKREPWWKLNPMGNTASYVYDWGGIGIAFLATRLDADDPLRTHNPNNITIVSDATGTPIDAPGDCTQLTSELMSAFPSWLQDNNELDSADVVVEVWLKYIPTSGATTAQSTATKSKFWYNSANPSVPLTDGTGFYVGYYKVKATNADTGSYSRITSYQASEPPPVGVAQYLYECLRVLHWEGQIIFVELECSDPLPIGCVWNATDGDAAWLTMNALVIRVEEDTATGTTRVQFGPPLMLGLQDIMEIVRANEGVRPSYQLSQRTDGQTSSAANVSETKHAGSASNTSLPLPASSAPPLPWDLSFRTDPANPAQWQVSVNAKSVLRNLDNSQLVVTGADGSWSNIDNTKTEAWIEGVVAGGATTPPATMKYGSASDFVIYGADWTATGPTVNDSASPPNQTKWRIGTATIDWSSGSPVAANLVGRNLQMFNAARANLPAVYPY